MIYEHKVWEYKRRGIFQHHCYYPYFVYCTPQASFRNPSFRTLMLFECTVILKLKASSHRPFYHVPKADLSTGETGDLLSRYLVATTLQRESPCPHAYHTRECEMLLILAACRQVKTSAHEAANVRLQRLCRRIG